MKNTTNDWIKETLDQIATQLDLLQIARDALTEYSQYLPPNGALKTSAAKKRQSVAPPDVAASDRRRIPWTAERRAQHAKRMKGLFRS